FVRKSMVTCLLVLQTVREDRRAGAQVNHGCSRECYPSGRVARNLWLCGAIGRGIRGLDGALVSKAFAALPQAFRYLTSQGQIQVFDQVSRRGFLALVPFA